MNFKGLAHARALAVPLIALVLAGLTHAGQYRRVALAAADVDLAKSPNENVTFVVEGVYKVTQSDINLGSLTLNFKLFDCDVGPDDPGPTTSTVLTFQATDNPGLRKFRATFAAFDPYPFDDYCDPDWYVICSDSTVAGDSVEVGYIETNTESSFPRNVANPASVRTDFNGGVPNNFIDPLLVFTTPASHLSLPVGGSTVVTTRLENRTAQAQLIALRARQWSFDGGAQQGYRIDPMVALVGPVPAFSTQRFDFTLSCDAPLDGALVLDASFCSDAAVQEQLMLRFGQ